MNTRTLSALAAIVASLSLFGCDEHAVPTQPTKDAAPRLQLPTDGRRAVLIGNQTPPASAPPEYQHYTWINVITDVGWLDAHTAYATVNVQYGANNATADVNLSVRSASGTVIGSNSGHAADSWVFPGDHTLRQSTTVWVAPTCGSIAQGTGSGTVFDSWLNTSQNTTKWGEQAQSDTKSAPQPSCTTPTTCQDVQANNYGGSLPCTYGSTGSGTVPPSGTSYPGQTYTPPTYVSGHWECTIWNQGTEYETRNCIWVSGYGNRLPLAPMSLARFAAPGAASPSSGADPLPSVFVVVSDQVPANAVAVIERHKTGPFKNVLLVPSSNVRPAVFVALMQALYESRAKDGESPAKELSITLSGSVLDQQIPSTDRDYAAAFTAQIASAKQGNAGAYGNRPIIEFKLAAKK